MLNRYLSIVGDPGASFDRMDPALESPETARSVLAILNEWCLTKMTHINQDILDGRRPWRAFSQELNLAVLTIMPEVEAFTPHQARQGVVLLGLVGASLGRHYQEADEAHRVVPEAAFREIRIGSSGENFQSYYARLAYRTATGHPVRDSYASLVRWNLPTVEVGLGGKTLATLPSVFDDGKIRTYTGAPDETRFFGLLKASEVLERAVNQELLPLSTGSVSLSGDEARWRINRAVILLDTLRKFNHDFAGRPASDGLRVNYFMDVFRQFAVHWHIGDVPPSGALDAEALIRDLLVGINLPNYPTHLYRVFPGLLDDERQMLDHLVDRVSLPLTALDQAGTSAEQLARLSVPDLRDLVVRRPELAALYLLLNAHSRAAGVHLRLSKLFLFGPQALRDEIGLGDPGVVSNRSGTTGMDERVLERLTHARSQHVLRPLRALSARGLEELAFPARFRSDTDSTSLPTVRFHTFDIDNRDLGIPYA